jgi:HSP20 family protein
MTIVKYNANRPVLRSLLDDFWTSNLFEDRLLNEKKWLPAVNVIEKDHSYIMELIAPGFNKEDFHISSENGMLMIEGNIENKEEVNEENYTRREFMSTSFSRSFTLPENIDMENINATYDKGVLTLEIKKINIPESKKLEIKVK